MTKQKKKRLELLKQKPNSLLTFLQYIVQGSSRKLLQVITVANESETTTTLVNLRPDNCTPPSVNEFPSDGFTRQQRKNGYIVIHVIVAFYAFILLAVVCDDFFVPSITKICESKLIILTNIYF